MDGVVADFVEWSYPIVNAYPINGSYPSEHWKVLSKHSRMYRDLKKTPYADRLVEECLNFAKVNNYEVLFLTAVPKGNDIHYAFFDKVNWAQHYFHMIPVHFGPYAKDKHTHCNPGDILIDDRLSNIHEWRQAGGVAIHHIDIDQTLKELNEYSSNR